MRLLKPGRGLEAAGRLFGVALLLGKLRQPQQGVTARTRREGGVGGGCLEQRARLAPELTLGERAADRVGHRALARKGLGRGLELGQPFGADAGEHGDQRLGQHPQEALKTARMLAKHQGFSKEAALGLLRSLALESLDAARDIDQLRRIWLQFDTADRRDAVVAAGASTRAAALGSPEEGRVWIKPFWDHLDDLGADDRAVLCEALVTVLAGIGPEWLPKLEAAAQSFPREGAVAYAVGCALAERQLWGKARPLLETAATDAALTPAARRHALLRLAQLAQEQGDAEQAARCYEAAARLE